jgi:hypothetical protein
LNPSSLLRQAPYLFSVRVCVNAKIIPLETSEWYFVKNWWKHQDYRFTHPPWIKLWVDVDNDPEFISLSELNQWRLVKLWVYASEMEGRLPRDSTKIGRRLGLYHSSSCSELISIFISKGFISQQDVRGMRKTKHRTETETETETRPPVVPQGGRHTRSKKSLEYSPEFLVFWQSYPRQEAKGKAAEAFVKANLNGNMPVVLAAIEAYKKTEQWQTPKYIPLPATWLNQRRWEDDPKPANGGIFNGTRELSPEDIEALADIEQHNREHGKDSKPLRLE